MSARGVVSCLRPRKADSISPGRPPAPLWSITSACVRSFDTSRVWTILALFSRRRASVSPRMSGQNLKSPHETPDGRVAKERRRRQRRVGRATTQMSTVIWFRGMTSDLWGMTMQSSHTCEHVSEDDHRPNRVLPDRVTKSSAVEAKIGRLNCKMPTCVHGTLGAIIAPTGQPSSGSPSALAQADLHVAHIYGHRVRSLAPIAVINVGNCPLWPGRGHLTTHCPESYSRGPIPTDCTRPPALGRPVVSGQQVWRCLSKLSCPADISIAHAVVCL